MISENLSASSAANVDDRKRSNVKGSGAWKEAESGEPRGMRDELDTRGLSAM